MSLKQTNQLNNATNTSAQPGVGNNKVDQIASLLTDGIPEESAEETVQLDEAEESVEEADTLESSEDDENPSDEPPAEVEESEDTTWESALGLSDGQVKFDDDGNLVGFNVKVNKETMTVKAADLIAAYQINKSLSQKQQAFAEERKVFDEKAKTFVDEYSKKLANAEAITNYLNQQILSEYNSIDWNQLRVENPAEYAAARQDFAMRVQELSEAKQALEQEKLQESQKINNQNAESFRNFIKDQRERMLQRNPEWADPEKFKSDMTGMKSFLSESYGFTENDFAQVYDARLIELIKDAKRYHDGTQVAKKKLSKPLPKFVKSSGKPIKAVSKLDALTKKAKSSTGSQKRVAQTDAIAELLMGGS